MESHPPFPNHLRKYRIQRGLSIEHIAEILGCPKKDIIKWENGDALPPTIIIFELCALYSITLEIAYPRLYSKLRSEFKQDNA
ncbi:MAG: helix-turn-helix transcriptional regulator [Bacteroidota bacterium]